MDRERVKKDRDIDAVDLAVINRLRREYEVDAQIVNALEKGNDFDLLWTHPAGINPARNRGCCPMRHATLSQEEAWCRGRFQELATRFAEGKEFDELDAAISDEVRAGRGKGTRKTDALSAIKVRAVASKRGQRSESERTFARARAHKDLKEFWLREEMRTRGAIVEVSVEDARTEHAEMVARALEQINADRDSLGLKRVKIVEE